MKIVCCIAAFLLTVAAAAQYPNQHEHERYPAWYENSLLRPRRQAPIWNGEHKIGDGKVFGQLGGSDAALYGKGGYQHTIFDNNRGKLDGSVYGTRVLGPSGGSTHLGGGLNWQNERARAAVDVSRQIHGPTSLDASAGYRWPLGKNGAAFVDGTYSRTFGAGRPNYGVMGGVQYRF